MNKHTKGPWRVGKYCVWSDEKYVAATQTGLSGEEQQANAALIAAAPELLEACKDILEWIDVSGLASTKSGGSGVLAYNGTEYNVVTQLRQAISKSEGRE